LLLDKSRLTALAFGVIDLLNFEQTCNFLLNSDNYDIFLELQKLCSLSDHLLVR